MADEPQRRDAKPDPDPSPAGSGPADRDDTARPPAPSFSELPPVPAGSGAGARTRRRQPPTFRAAGFWRRLGGGLVDLAIIVPLSLLLSWIAGAIAGISLPESRHYGVDFWLDLLLASDPALMGILGLLLAIGSIYALVFQITLAATPGMRLAKTRIIDLYGDPPSTARALARTAGYLAGVFTLALGFLWIGFDSEKRGIHDWLAGTYVVRV